MNDLFFVEQSDAEYYEDEIDAILTRMISRRKGLGLLSQDNESLFFYQQSVESLNGSYANSMTHKKWLELRKIRSQKHNIEVTVKSENDFEVGNLMHNQSIKKLSSPNEFTAQEFSQRQKSLTEKSLISLTSQVNVEEENQTDVINLQQMQQQADKVVNAQKEPSLIVELESENMIQSAPVIIEDFTQQGEHEEKIKLQNEEMTQKNTESFNRNQALIQIPSQQSICILEQNSPILSIITSKSSQSVTQEQLQKNHKSTILLLQPNEQASELVQELIQLKNELSNFSDLRAEKQDDISVKSNQNQPNSLLLQPSQVQLINQIVNKKQQKRSNQSRQNQVESSNKDSFTTSNQHILTLRRQSINCKSQQGSNSKVGGNQSKRSQSKTESQDKYSSPTSAKQITSRKFSEPRIQSFNIIKETTSLPQKNSQSDRQLNHYSSVKNHSSQNKQVNIIINDCENFQMSLVLASNDNLLEEEQKTKETDFISSYGIDRIIPNVRQFRNNNQSQQISESQYQTRKNEALRQNSPQKKSPNQKRKNFQKKAMTYEYQNEQNLRFEQENVQLSERPEQSPKKLNSQSRMNSAVVSVKKNSRILNKVNQLFSKQSLENPQGDNACPKRVSLPAKYPANQSEQKSIVRRRIEYIRLARQRQNDLFDDKFDYEPPKSQLLSHNRGQSRDILIRNKKIPTTSIKVVKDTKTIAQRNSPTPSKVKVQEAIVSPLIFQQNKRLDGKELICQQMRLNNKLFDKYEIDHISSFLKWQIMLTDTTQCSDSMSNFQSLSNRRVKLQSPQTKSNKPTSVLSKEHNLIEPYSSNKTSTRAFGKMSI